MEDLVINVTSKTRVFLGTYTTEENKSQGIYIYDLDETTGKLTNLVGSGPLIDNPSFLTISDDCKFVYAVNETEHGSVTSLSLDTTGTKLQVIDKQPSIGDDPCHIQYTKDSLLIANYSSGTLTSWTYDN
jgi:6-phosphogluconolactonase